MSKGWKGTEVDKNGKGKGKEIVTRNRSNASNSDTVESMRLLHDLQS